MAEVRCRRLLTVTANHRFGLADHFTIRPAGPVMLLLLVHFGRFYLVVVPLTSSIQIVVIKTLVLQIIVSQIDTIMFYTIANPGKRVLGSHSLGPVLKAFVDDYQCLGRGQKCISTTEIPFQVHAGDG